MCVNIHSKGNQSWNTDIDIEKSCFLCRVKIPYRQSLTFLIFINIFRSSRSQMFFKIGALKNFAIFRIKKSLQQWRFLVSIAKFLRTAFLQNFSVGCLCIFQTVSNQLVCKGVNVNRFLKKCPCYDALIIFSSQHVLERRIVWCTKSWIRLFTNLSSIVRFSK